METLPQTSMDTEMATINRGPPGTQEPARQGLWRRRSGLEKVLLGVCGVALVACAALVGVVTTSSSSSTSISSFSAPVEEQLPQAQPLVLAQESKEDPPQAAQAAAKPVKASRLPVLKGPSRTGQEVEVCNTLECTQAAAEFVQAMDTSVDPCNNFYKFACGGWMDTHPVPDHFSRWNQFNILERELDKALSTILTEPISLEDPHPIAKAKTFYAGCMDEELLEKMGSTPLTDFLGQFGGWPMATNEWNATSFDWHTAFAQSRIHVFTDYPVSVYVSPDNKDTYTSAIYIDQTSLALPRSVFVEPENNEIDMIYKLYITNIAQLIAESLSQTVDATQMEKDVEDLLAFEKKLAAITTPAEHRRNVNRMYNPMTIQELSSFSSMDWLPILSTIFASADVTVTLDTRVIVKELDFIKNITRLMSSTSNRTHSNYILWRHVKRLLHFTTQAMRDASFEFSEVASGVTAEKPRKNRNNECAEMSNDYIYLGMAIATEYVKDYFPQQAKNETNEMVEDLRSAFKSLLKDNKWLDEETKPKTIEKADFITKFVGYPDWFGNETALETYYLTLGDLDNKTYFANIMALRLRRFGTNLFHLTCYVEDIFVRVKDFQELQILRHRFIAESELNFTYEEATNGRLPFLDVLDSAEIAGFKTTVFFKPTNKGLCLNGEKEQPMDYLLNRIAPPTPPPLILKTAIYSASSAFTLQIQPEDGKKYNSISIPAGILQPPFYRPNTMMALNYGGIGQDTRSHTASTTRGASTDKDGNALPWWSNETSEAFKSHAQCIVDQYDAIHLPELDELQPNTTLNGINTQGENIADNGGLREALLAYKMYVDRYGEEPRLPGLTDYSPMQLFFLSNANIWCSSITNEGLLNQVLTDPHSPGTFRVLVPMSNMEEFSEIWECPVGSNMNPEHKCVVW
ncbi:Neprilysin-1 [Chionoecetes opilio]|uniref:Neprilysin-1 n=1 Tax=Chionoecetes opilio TaxID=41210 RepID=A0A8J4XWZ5_CHIOP|nr:Neprilysin-1 [Chionoecetes opilio]